MLVNVSGIVMEVMPVKPMKALSGITAMFVDAKLIDVILVGIAPVTGLIKAVRLMAVTLAPKESVEGTAPT